MFGMTPDRIRQIEGRALRRLRNQTPTRAAKEYLNDELPNEYLIYGLTGDSTTDAPPPEKKRKRKKKLRR
jgi:hypothetical protein